MDVPHPCKMAPTHPSASQDVFRAKCDQTKRSIRMAKRVCPVSSLPNCIRKGAWKKEKTEEQEPSDMYPPCRIQLRTFVTMYWTQASCCTAAPAC